MLRKDVYPYIQAWVSIEKTEQYKEYVLDFLRSFLSTVRSNRKFVTQNSEKFQKFKDTDKFTSHAPFVQVKTNMKMAERVPTLEEMRTRLNLDNYKFSEKDDKTIYNDNIQNMEEIKKRKQELINGNKNFLKGIYSGATSTNYQEVFK